ERVDYRGKAPDRLAGAGRAHRDRMAVARGRQHDVERPRAQAQQRQLGDLHVERPRLRFGEDRRDIAALDGTALENLAEGVDPLPLDPVGQHDDGSWYALGAL